MTFFHLLSVIAFYVIELSWLSHMTNWQLSNYQGYEDLVPKTILTASLGYGETNGRASPWMKETVERNNKNTEVTGRDEGGGADVKNRN